MWAGQDKVLFFIDLGYTSLIVLSATARGERELAHKAWDNLLSNELVLRGVHDPVQRKPVYELFTCAQPHFMDTHRGTVDSRGDRMPGDDRRTAILTRISQMDLFNW